MSVDRLIWRSEFYKSEEDCRIRFSGEDPVVVHSIVTGESDKKEFEVGYHILADSDWKTRICEVRIFKEEILTEFFLMKNSGTWFLNDEPRPDLDHCADVDIQCTPFTNSLPVNRLSLNIGEAKTISVIYFDIDEKTVTAKDQRYTKLSGNTYRFETVPNDFEAIISTDENGFVVDYPGLFNRVG